MNFNDTDGPRSTAMEQLEALGLTTYAARTLVSLISLGEATAREVSEVEDVPRTRVYDAVDELRERGLVEVQRSSPQRFHVVSAEEVCRTFESEHDDLMDALSSSLAALEPAPVPRRERGVWTVSGSEAVSERVVDFVEAADREILFSAAPSTMTPTVIDSLSDADERGIDVTIADQSPTATETLLERVPGATTVSLPWSDGSPRLSRLLVVDRDGTFVAVGGGGYRDEETAVWGTGESNGFVVVLRSLVLG